MHPVRSLVERMQLFAQNQSGLRVGQLVTLNNRSGAHGLVPAPDLSSVWLISLLLGYVPNKASTGNGVSGPDTGEGAWETATTSKEGSRRANYPLPARGGSDEK